MAERHPSMADGWLTLGDAHAFVEPGASRAINGRQSGKRILVLRTTLGDYTCMDAHCFHQGADLSEGELIEIENLGAVVRCPRHGRCVSARTGEWVEASEGGGSSGHVEASQGSGWCGRGHVQRMHEVRIDQAGRLQIRLTDDGHRPSDTYNKPAEPAQQPAAPGSGGGTIAWKSRKRAATEAVKQRATPSKPAAAAAAAVHPTMRQPRIDALFSPRSSPGAASSAEPESEAMDMDTE
tara:strand:+ start:1738 stop:2451 length:714 start_codon:yes stop_codon:yes gene_type:complete